MDTEYAVSEQDEREIPEKPLDPELVARIDENRVVREGDVDKRQPWHGCVPFKAVCDLLGYLRCYLRVKRVEDCAEPLRELISKGRFLELTDVNDADRELFRQARCSHPNTRLHTRGSDGHHESCPQCTRTVGTQSCHPVRTDRATRHQASVLCSARCAPAQRNASPTVNQERYSWFVPIDDENTGCAVKSPYTRV